MQKEDASKRLFLCLFIVYIINVFGKIAFSAVTVELVSDGILTKTQAGTCWSDVLACLCHRSDIWRRCGK